MNSKEEAKVRAMEVRAMMDTQGWKIRVNENCGWHWTLTNLDGHLTLSESCVRGEFYAMLSGGEYTGTGSYNWHSTRQFKNPNRAVQHILILARAYAEKTSNWVNQTNRIYE